MRVCVFGATGSSGKIFVRRALAADYDITALVRETVSSEVSDMRVRVVQGDVRDSAAVANALHGADAAALLIGVRQGRQRDNSRSVGTQVIVEAMQAIGVRRLMVVSTVGVGSSRQNQSLLSRWLLPHLIGAWRLAEAGLQERTVADSGLDWTIVRPPRLVDGPGTGAWRADENLHTTMGSRLAREDLAAFLLEGLRDGRFIHRSPTLRA